MSDVLRSTNRHEYISHLLTFHPIISLHLYGQAAARCQLADGFLFSPSPIQSHRTSQAFSFSAAPARRRSGGS